MVNCLGLEITHPKIMIFGLQKLKMKMHIQLKLKFIKMGMAQKFLLEIFSMTQILSSIHLKLLGL